MVFGSGHRLVIEKDRTGNVSLIRNRRLRKDKVSSIPRLHIRGVEVVAGDDETADQLYILSKPPGGTEEKLEVDRGDKKTLVSLAITLSEHLDVPFTGT